MNLPMTAEVNGQTSGGYYQAVKGPNEDVNVYEF